MEAVFLLRQRRPFRFRNGWSGVPAFQDVYEKLSHENYLLGLAAKSSCSRRYHG